MSTSDCYKHTHTQAPCMHTYTYTHIPHIYTHVYTHIHIPHTYILHIYIHITHIHTYIPHTYIKTHTHMLTQKLRVVNLSPSLDIRALQLCTKL